MWFVVDGIFLNLSRAVTILPMFAFGGITETKRVSFELEPGQKKSISPLTSSSASITYSTRNKSNEGK